MSLHDRDLRRDLEEAVFGAQIRSAVVSSIRRPTLKNDINGALSNSLHYRHRRGKKKSHTGLFHSFLCSPVSTMN